MTTLLSTIRKVVTLDNTGKIPVSQLPSGLLGAVTYQGVWDALANSPALASGVGVKGYYYKVSVGTTSGTVIDGISEFYAGDLIIFNGTTWDKIDGVQSEVLSVAGRTGDISLSTTDVAEGTNLYYLPSRVIFDSPVRSVNGRTGVISIESSDVSSALGYAAVQQGTGIAQSLANAIKIGWGGSSLKATVDSTDLGSFVFQSDLLAASIPSGTIIYRAANAIPTGYIKANGAAVSRTTYATLFGVIGTSYGAGDGSTTFNLPDLRGEFVRGWDDGRGIDAGRVFGDLQLDEFKSHNHSINALASGSGLQGVWGINGSVQTGYQLTAEGGAETRPRNLAFLALIKY